MATNAANAIRALLAMPVSRLTVDADTLHTSAADATKNVDDISRSYSSILHSGLSPLEHHEVPSTSGRAVSFGGAAAFNSFGRKQQNQQKSDLSIAQKFDPGDLRSNNRSHSADARRSQHVNGLQAVHRPPEADLRAVHIPASILLHLNTNSSTFGEKTANWHLGLRSKSAGPTPATAPVSARTREKIDIDNQLALIKQKVSQKKHSLERKKLEKERKLAARPAAATLYRPRPAESHPPHLEHCHGGSVPATSAAVLPEQTPHQKVTCATEKRSLMISQLLTVPSPKRPRASSPNGTGADTADRTLLMACHLLSGDATRDFINLSRKRLELLLETDAERDGAAGVPQDVPVASATGAASTASNRLRAVSKELGRMREYRSCLLKNLMEASATVKSQRAQELLAMLEPIRRKCRDLDDLIAATSHASAQDNAHQQSLYEYKRALVMDLRLRWQQRLVLHELHFYAAMRVVVRRVTDMAKDVMDLAYVYEGFLSLKECWMNSLVYRVLERAAEATIISARASRCLCQWRTRVKQVRQLRKRDELARCLHTRRTSDKIFRALKGFVALRKAAHCYDRAVQPWAHRTMEAKAFFAWRAHTCRKSALKRKLLCSAAVASSLVDSMCTEQSHKNLHAFLSDQRLRAAANVIGAQYLERARKHRRDSILEVFMPRILVDGKSLCGNNAVATFVQQSGCRIRDLQLSSRWAACVLTELAGKAHEDEEVDVAPTYPTKCVPHHRLVCRMVSGRLGYQVQPWQLWKYSNAAEWARADERAQQRCVTTVPVSTKWLHTIGLAQVDSSMGAPMLRDMPWEPLPRTSPSSRISLGSAADSYAHTKTMAKHLLAWLRLAHVHATARRVAEIRCLGEARRAMRAWKQSWHLWRRREIAATQAVLRRHLRSNFYAWTQLYLAEREQLQSAAQVMNQRRARSALGRWVRYLRVDCRRKRALQARAIAFCHAQRCRIAFSAWASYRTLQRRAAEFLKLISYRGAWRAVVQLWPRWQELSRRRLVLKKVIGKAVEIRGRALPGSQDQSWEFSSVRNAVQHWLASKRAEFAAQHVRILTHTADAFWRHRRLSTYCLRWNKRARMAGNATRIVQMRRTATLASHFGELLNLHRHKERKLRAFHQRWQRASKMQKAFHAWLMYLAIERRWKFMLASRCFQKWKTHIVQKRRMAMSFSTNLSVRRVFDAWKAVQQKSVYERDACKFFSQQCTRRLQRDHIRLWVDVLRLTLRQRHSLTQISGAVLHEALPIRKALQSQQVNLPSGNHLAIPQIDKWVTGTGAPPFDYRPVITNAPAATETPSRIVRLSNAGAAIRGMISYPLRDLPTVDAAPYKEHAESVEGGENQAVASAALPWSLWKPHGVGSRV